MLTTRSRPASPINFDFKGYFTNDAIPSAKYSAEICCKNPVSLFDTDSIEEDVYDIYKDPDSSNLLTYFKQNINSEFDIKLIKNLSKKFKNNKFSVCKIDFGVSVLQHLKI